MCNREEDRGVPLRRGEAGRRGRAGLLSREANGLPDLPGQQDKTEVLRYGAVPRVPEVLRGGAEGAGLRDRRGAQDRGQRGQERRVRRRVLSGLLVHRGQVEEGGASTGRFWRARCCRRWSSTSWGAPTSWWTANTWSRWLATGGCGRGRRRDRVRLSGPPSWPICRTAPRAGPPVARRWVAWDTGLFAPY
jgi:hypothetical protein